MPTRSSPLSPSRGQLPAAAAIAALALSAGGLAAAPMASAATRVEHATVLRVMKHAEVVLVTPGHAVYSERLPSSMVQLGFGTRIQFRMAAQRPRLLHVSYTKATAVTFYATVRRVHGTHLQVRLDSHAMLQIRLSAPASLARGQRILITETAAGRITVHQRHGGASIASGSASLSGAGNPGSPASAGSGSSAGGSSANGSAASGSNSTTPVAVTPVDDGPESTASGAIVFYSGTTLQLAQANGTTLSLTMPADAISYLNENEDITICETANVSYHQGPSGPVVDFLAPTGVSSSASVTVPNDGTCATQSGDGGDDVVGTVTASSESSITLSVPGAGSETFPVDPGSGLTDGFDVGSIVDVTYDPTSANEAIDIEQAEFYTTGVASMVDENGGTLDILDSQSGATDSFDAEDADYSNLAVGNDVGVVYWNNDGELQGDNVSDLTTGAVN